VVLDALCTRLMSPELFASFTRGFTAEWNREQGTRDAEQSRKRDELKRIDGKIGNLVAAIANGGGSAAVYAVVTEAEVHKEALETELSVAEAPAPRPMPNLPEL